MNDPALAVSRDSDAVLSWTERAALSVTGLVNRAPLLRAVSHFWNTRVVSRLVDVLSRGRLVIVGLEHLERLPADRGVLFAPNHRSFFDLFVVAKCAYDHVPGYERLYFPVRSSFWYDRWLGLALNALATGCSMYPPVFRPAEKRAVTRTGLEFLARELRRPGTLSGMHPEGTRGKGGDPYELLPPERGFGRVALSGRPSVVPVFINGLSNSITSEIRAAWSRDPPKIFVLFGPPIALPDAALLDVERLRTQIEVGRLALREIEKLAANERLLSRSCRSQPGQKLAR